MKLCVPEYAAVRNIVQAAAVHIGGSRRARVVKRAQSVGLIAAVGAAWNITHENRSFHALVCAEGAVFIAICVAGDML